MANVLKMALTHAIIGLLEQGWSYRRISAELGVHRETVSRYDRLRLDSRSKPANPPPGSDGKSDSKPANATAGSSALWLPERHSIGPPSLCDPFESTIKDKLEKGLSAQRIWQDLMFDYGFVGSYSSVKRFVRRLGKSTPLPFRRMECEPGHEAQVDFGTGSWIIDNGKKCRSYVFRIVLSNSRKSYSEAVFKQNTENFIRVLENSFRHFGGVPKTLVPDNMKTAVKNPDWFDPELNPKLVEFARHYGFVILPTKVCMPRHKGKVESGIKYVKNNGLKNRTFTSLADENKHLFHWETSIADTRIHGTTRKQVGKVFKEIEQPSLTPLPKEPFPFYQEGRRKVNRDGHVEVAKAYYSVPPEHLGREVWIRWDSRLVRIYNNRFEQIAVHARVLPGKFNTNRSHLADKKISVVERGAEYMIEKAMRIGNETGQWANAMIEARGIEGMRVLQGLLSLARKHPADAINKASRVAFESHCFKLKPLKKLCVRFSEQQQEFIFTESHPIIRSLSEYQSLVPKVSFKIEKEEEVKT